MIKIFRNLFYDPRVRDLNVDNPSLLEFHNKIINEKKILRSAFNSFYDVMLNCSKKFIKVEGREFELGSGVGFFKKKRRGIITTDIRDSKYIDRILDAQKMKLKDHSVGCFYAINVFHHLPKPDLFFEELIRVLVLGGGVILIEPHNGFFSRTVHKYLHKNEIFDIFQKGWTNKKILGPLSGANQALSYLVFERDKKKFNKKYGNFLEIKHQTYINNGLRYFLSGGLNFRQLLPDFFLHLIQWIECLLSPLSKHISLYQVTVIIRK